jgi:endonuclease/exonuclease/phosphatase family metal-dependent hydrolase
MKHATIQKIYSTALFILLALTAASCTSPKEAAVEKPSAPPGPATAAAEKTPLRDSVKIISINTLHALHDAQSVKRFASWVRMFAPDVVAVQQIDRPMEGKKDFDAVRELAQQLDMRPFFGVARYYKGFDSGNAVFSVYPIKQSTVESLPVSKGKVRRSLAYTVIDVGLQSVGFASTEVDDQSPAERKKQAQELVTMLPQFIDFPFVLCGEFYEPSSGAAAGVMKDTFVCANDLGTAPVAGTQHLYAAGRSTVKPVAAKKIVNQDIHSDAIMVMLHVVSQ